MNEVIFIAGAGAVETESRPAALYRELNKLSDLTASASINKKEVRDCIRAVSRVLEGMPDGQDNATLEHFFADGVYGRRWGCKRGVVLTTRIHIVQHISTLSRGKIVVASTDGLSVVEAGAMFVTEPGTQRVILVLEDAVFTTVHANPDNERDPEVLTKRFTIGPFDEYEEAV